MALVQQLRAMLHALGAADSLAGSFMASSSAKPSAAPSAATKAAFIYMPYVSDKTHSFTTVRIRVTMSQAPGMALVQQLRAMLHALGAADSLAGSLMTSGGVEPSAAPSAAAKAAFIYMPYVSDKTHSFTTVRIRVTMSQAPGMAPVQQLRAMLHALGAADSLAGSLMTSGGVEPSAAPSAAAKAVFRAQHAAVLVDPSGQLNLATGISPAELQQVMATLPQLCRVAVLPHWVPMELRMLPANYI